MTSRVKAAIQAVLHQFGLDIRRHPPADDIALRRVRILGENKITLVIDVGANTGQYARKLRSAGYTGRIVSFEPSSDPFTELSWHVAPDNAWECRQLALGEVDGEAKINVAGNSLSSSILPMCNLHLATAPDSAYVGTEMITMVRLDTVRSELIRNNDVICLKLDVQGYEMKVLSGATGTLPRTRVLEIELSLAALYEGQPSFCQMIDYLDGAGFDLVSLETAFKDPQSGRILQLDGIFVRRFHPSGTPRAYANGGTRSPVTEDLAFSSESKEAYGFGD